MRAPKGTVGEIKPLRRRGMKNNFKKQQWEIRKSGYFPVGKTIKKLPCGMYQPRYCPQEGEYLLAPLDFKKEDIYRFPESDCDQILSDLEVFLSKKEEYQKYNIPWKRGILLYGPTGSGKSGIVQYICEKVVERNGIILFPDYTDDTLNTIQNLLQIENGRLIVSVFEDFESALKEPNSERRFLQFLDGISGSQDGVINLGTTNFIDDVADRLKNRPSRFDMVREIKYPEDNVREAYLRKFFKEEYSEDLVEKTEGFGFSHLKEFCIQVLIFKRSVDEVTKFMTQSFKEEAAGFGVKRK